MPEITKSVETFFTLQMPYCENLELRRTVFKCGDGPRVAVTGGIHGDELEGLHVCHLLAAWLERLTTTSPEGLRGTVELYPALNTLGIDTLTRSLPVFDTDLNRNFPGSPDGDVPHRITNAIMENLAGADLVIDIHASNIFLREIPQVRINQEFADHLVPLARKMNLDLIWLHGAVTVLESTIAHSLNSTGVPCLVVEMGVGMRITPEYGEQLVTGILTVWKDLGLIAPEIPLNPQLHHPLVADDSNVHYLNAHTSGLFVPAASHWTDVHKGELLGNIISPHHGEILSQLRSPVNGILFTLREYPIVYEGSLVARIMAVKQRRK
jgi:uncharacterized protein